MDIELCVIETVEALDENYELLPENVKKQLKSIEEIISGKESLLGQCKDNLKQSDFSIKSISKELGCSRTTLYNTPLFKKYIEYRSEVLENNNPIQQVKISQNKIKELNDVIKQMELRDVEIENLKHEIKILNNKLKEATEVNENLRISVNEYKAQLSKDSEKSHKNTCLFYPKNK